MASEYLPAALALGGGIVVGTGVVVHEQRQLRAMRQHRARLGLRFPLGLEPAAAHAALTGLTGLPFGSEIVAEVTGHGERTTHALVLPTTVRASVTATLQAAIPGLRLSQQREITGGATLAVRLGSGTPVVLSDDDPAQASAALLAGLGGLHPGEQVVVRWALRASPAPEWAPRAEHPTPRQRALGREWERKARGQGFRVTGLIMVQAATVEQAHRLASHVLHVVAARASQSGMRSTRVHGVRDFGALPRATWRSGWLTAAELLPLLAWPLGPAIAPGVEVGASRELLVPARVARSGRVMFTGRDARGDRPVALSAESARHHVGIAGPSGAGKSVLVARNILDDIRAGHGGAVIDPKADLVDTVLARVPDRDADRVVVLDPAVAGARIGIDILGHGDPDLRADVLVGALQALFRDSWGIRSEHYTRLALRTLTEIPGATLMDIPRLFADPNYRRDAVARLDDAFIVAQWEAFDALSRADQIQQVQAPMTKLMTLLARPAVRGVLASPEPKLDIPALLAERKWLLVSLAPGALGEPAARLLGAMLLYVIWSAVEARAVLPPEARHPLFLYVDELASLSDLPFGFELLAERARGLGAGLTVAMQTLGRLPEGTRSALLGNVGTLISFRAGAEEAARIARELPGLSALDIQSLGRFEVAARVGTGTGSSVAVVTGRTEPLPEPTNLGDRIRARSLERYGVEAASTPPAAPAAPPTPPGDPDTRPGRARRRS